MSHPRKRSMAGDGSGDRFGPEAIRQVVQVDRLVFERPSKALDKDIVHAPAPAVHGDGDTGVLKYAGEFEAGELAAPIGIEDVRPTVTGQRLVQCLDAEPGVHGVPQPPGERMTRRSNTHLSFLIWPSLLWFRSPLSRTEGVHHFVPLTRSSAVENLAPEGSTQVLESQGIASAAVSRRS